MATVSLTRTVNASLHRLWKSWDAFGAIDAFNPNLRRSFLLDGSAETGVGARRQCDLADGKNYIQERITEYVPGSRMVVDIYNGTLPIKNTVATFDFRALGPDRSEVTMTMEFHPKFGPFGALMAPMMKPQFRKLLGRLLDGNKAFVERGEVVRMAA